MSSRVADPVQEWLDAHRAGLAPPADDLCRLCLDRLRALVRPRLRRFPVVRQEEPTTAIANGVLLRLVRALRKHAPESNLELDCLLGRMIQRELLDLKKKAVRRRARVGRLADDPAAGTDHPIAPELTDALHEVIAGLPDDAQELFHLIYYRGLSTAVAAEELGVPVSTLKRRWAEARYAVNQRCRGESAES